VRVGVVLAIIGPGDELVPGDIIVGVMFVKPQPDNILNPKVKATEELTLALQGLAEET